MDDLVFEQLNPGACRTYLVGSRTSKEVALIDPVLGSVPDYLALLSKRGLTLRYAIDTHTHADHLSGGPLLMERTGAEYAMHKGSGAKHSSLRLTDGSTIEIGGVTIEAIETPGHTRDSLSFRVPGVILTGDWLFIGGAGRTDLPGGDPGEHWDSLQRVIPKLDESTIIYPGHDYQNRMQSTLADEKRTNVNLKPRSRDQYVAWLAAMSQPTPEWMIDTVRANNDGTTDPEVNFMPEDVDAVCMCQPAPSLTVPSITVQEVQASEQSSDDRLLLDVRQPEEYVGPLGHVPGAVLIPLGELQARISEIEDYRNRTVVCICRSGARSAQAAEILRNSGFDNVLNMTGGTLAWRQKGFAVER